ncbi:MAG TPA: sodium/proline symporter [Bdellovibrionales bacterium]|nr:sodium:proline symporter [Pseudobdellovibrionaceae bacterium]HAG91926.1 sodium/proline symporter [Bdellovibrionales bacterium]
MIILSFAFFLILFVAIGLLSALKSKSTNKDYLVAGRSVKPWLAALSAVSTNNSGYMFIGQIGFTFVQGLSSIWLMIGWVTGDLIMSFIVHKKFREVSEKRGSLSFGGLVANWWGEPNKRVRILIGLITILFLGAYAAAQLKAGGKALNVLFGWDDSAGVILGTVMVVAYCFAGGIRASIWTDAAQSFVMIGAMSTLFVYALAEMGGVSSFIDQLYQVSDTYMNVFPTGLSAGPIAGPALFVFGWLFAGFGIVGQPHIMIRMMTLDDPKSLTRFRSYYYFWYIAFYIAAIGVGLCSRLILGDVGGFDPELALPRLSQELLPDLLVGMMLAGIFAATMSTADSQILSCSAALTRDIFSSKPSNIVTKIGTVSVAVVALVIALFGSQNVFQLVLMSWSILGAAFAPILVIYAFGFKIYEKTLFAMILGSIGMVLIWRALGYSSAIYEIAPGILTGIGIYFVSRFFSGQGAKV